MHKWDIFKYKISLSQGPYLKESLNTFVVGHWSVSKQMTSRHFSIENDGNLIFVEHVPAQCNNEEQLPVGAYAWLIKHLSREVDTVIDAGSSTVYTMVAALKEGRNAVWLNTSASQCEHSTLHSKISSLISSDI